MSNQEWISKYRTNKDAVWVKCRLTDGQQFYHDEFKGWIDIKKICEEQGVFVEELKLSFRSHEVTIDIDENAEAIYLVKSVMGQIGAETKHYYTTGILKDGVVYKQMWLTPELVVDKEFEDRVDECFEQAMIYNEQKRENSEKPV
jgi:hypothetical protein|tara:strand:+ start:143 stop:577 length:435 start_codon:yes stop_codon:yes gene_type:complete